MDKSTPGHSLRPWEHLCPECTSRGVPGPSYLIQSVGVGRRCGGNPRWRVRAGPRGSTTADHSSHESRNISIINSILSRRTRHITLNLQMTVLTQQVQVEAASG
jgi:hypothetical protein